MVIGPLWSPWASNHRIALGKVGALRPDEGA